MRIRSATRVQLLLVVSFAWTLLFDHDSLARDLRRLEPRETIEVSGCERFAAADGFGVGKRIGNRIVATLGFNFAKLFLTDVESNIDFLTLQAWRLSYTADDLSLIANLGGERRAVVSLCSIHRAMEISSIDSAIVSATASFAFVRSPVDSRLFAIHWFVNQDNQWVIGAVEVPHPVSDWPAGSKVFSNATTEASKTH